MKNVKWQHKDSSFVNPQPIAIPIYYSVGTGRMNRDFTGRERPYELCSIGNHCLFSQS
jgi:hypothetical protein